MSCLPPFLAVMRGLTTEERQKVRTVLVQPRLPIRLSDNKKAELRASERRIQAHLCLEVLKGHKKIYFFKNAQGVLPKGLIIHQEDDLEHHEGEAETYLEEGVHYFTSEESRKAALEKVQKQFFDIFECRNK